LVISCLDKIRKSLNTIDLRLKSIKASRVNSLQDRENIKQFVRNYFYDLRREIYNIVKNENELKSLDNSMQELLRYAQRRTSVNRYKFILGICRQELNRIESKVIQIVGSNYNNILDQKERIILETLRQIHPEAAICYEQGLNDLLDPNRKSWRGTIVEFREGLREILDYLAPDQEIMKSQEFKLETGLKHPSMRQKTLFILKSRGLRKSQSEPAEKAVQAIEEAIGSLVRSVYDKASSGVHNLSNKAEALRVMDWVTVVLAELLEVKR